MKKTALVTLGLTLMVIISLSFTRDEPHFKNLKILPKNITEEQMDSVMHHFSLSLGVRCTFCHKHSEDMKTWDFASDENKHKLRAREMMKLTQKINSKYFDVAGSKRITASLMVTCYTCHHGSNDPSTKPPMQPRTEQRPQADSTRHDGDSTRHN
jgi:hypothetical protein